MKTRFSTVDLMAVLHEVQPFIGMRVNNVYDIDHKTYLIKLQQPDSKAMLLIESGMRFHPSEYDWPKQPMPSNFSMKLRKHIRQKRLEQVRQLGIDRIIDLQFGSNEVACHVIVELYDRGNIILTDNNFIILNVLRPRTDKDTDVRFQVREPYPISLSRQYEVILPCDDFREMFDLKVKKGAHLRKSLNPLVPFGAALLDHCLIANGICLTQQSIGKDLDIEKDWPMIYGALELAQGIFVEIRNGTQIPEGVVTLRREKRTATAENENEWVETFDEFHPMLFNQHNKTDYFCKFDTFWQAIDTFFSQFEVQKLETRALQAEKQAFKKLDNIKRDHEKRVADLKDSQEEGKRKAEFIELNLETVDKAIFIIRSALANQMSWQDIDILVDEARLNDDPVAGCIKKLKLDSNQITMKLLDPYFDDQDETSSNHEMFIDIDLGLGAYQNARSYFDQKKQAAVKEQKTLDASVKAMKTAEHKTNEQLKKVQIKTNISKHRKTLWFEKFYWFISSEDFLVIGGRDQQQNELIVKRHLRIGDLYVHGDVRGASSVIIKNPTNVLVPPRTLNEAGCMAICYSAAWDAKVVTSAWWVNCDQVSKTAPTGEYLTTGSFMIRGKKNFLPPSQLVMGFGFMFRLDEDSIQRHKSERIVHDNVEIEVPDVIEDSAPELPEEDETDGSTAEHCDDDAFPDVHVPVRHTSVISDDVLSESSRVTGSLPPSYGISDDVTIVQTGYAPRAKIKPVSQQNKPLKPAQKRAQAKQRQTEEDQAGGDEDGAKESNKQKRGQKFKQRKAKQKYADQDEDEKEMRMTWIGAHGPLRERKADKKWASRLEKTAETVIPLEGLTSEPAQSLVVTKESVQVRSKVNPDEIVQVDEQPIVVNDVDDESDNDTPEESIDSIAQILAPLTGQPLNEDTLLYAMPAVGPYTVMQSFKYKVKVTPGTTKKGKATKSAMQSFINDKDTTQIEKDLLKVVQESDIGRNLPGKVKFALNIPDVKLKKK